jgi:hypothetical protein
MAFGSVLSRKAWGFGVFMSNQSAVRHVYALTTALLVGTCLSSPAWATDFNVNSDATLRSAITSAGSGDRIVFTGNVTLAADLPAVQTNVTIVGNGNSLSGNNQFRGLFIGAFSGATQVPVTVAVQDLTITDTRARGGTGGQRAGGGAGLGGAIFVASQASVTVSNVNLTGNAAVGGNGGITTSGFGGGGGMGGNGGTQVGGGGGLGSGATGGNNGSSAQGGIATGASSRRHSRCDRGRRRRRRRRWQQLWFLYQRRCRRRRCRRRRWPQW